MKFPILIHLLNNKANHIVMSFDEMPVNHYFKIVKTGINPLDNYEVEVDYRRVEEPESQEVVINESPPENNEPSIIDSPDRGTSGGSEDSSGTSL